MILRVRGRLCQWWHRGWQGVCYEDGHRNVAVMAEKSIDVFRWMPCNAFEILSVFQEDSHALEVSIRLG
jgi:hypothetical protein